MQILLGRCLVGEFLAISGCMLAVAFHAGVVAIAWFLTKSLTRETLGEAGFFEGSNLNIYIKQGE